jgi:hypothetical protein
MKYTFALLLLLLCCATACKRKPDDVVADDIKKVQKINDNINDYTLKQVDDLTAQMGGSIAGYYKDKEVKKIAAENYFDTCRTFTDYYFDDGMLIYVVEQNYIYNKPASYTEEVAKAHNDSIWYDDTKTRVEVNRFYFGKNKMVRWIAPGKKEVPITLPEFTDTESALWGKSLILLKELKEQ